MKNYLPKFLFVFVILAVYSLSAFGQGTGVTGSISGAVTDPNGSVVAGATVTVKNNTTLVENTATTSDNGTFTVPALATGFYTVTIAHSGFKQAVVTDVKVNVGTPSSVNVALEVGAASETVTVVGGGEILQTQSATVGTTITGREITDIPMASRNALDLILNLPGTSTVGRPRTSSVNGLPKNAVNITLDGVNVQDPLLKNSDGFFTYIQPKTDAIQEVTLSTATPGAESNGQGAVQIKFATRQGSPEFHGSAYIYHRNSYFNANYYFNNRDLPPDPVDKTAPRNRVLLTQPGFRIGGPIRIPKLIKNNNTAFFFVNYEEFRLPESVTRQRVIFTPQVLTGAFSWIRTSTAANALCTQINATQQQCTQNLLTLAGASGFTSTKDPIIGPLLDSINGTTGKGGVTAISGDPNIQQFSFINRGFQKRQFPTVNLTWNITKNHQLTNVYNYQIFRTQVDFLNNADPRFPDFPNHGAQNSNRFSDSATLVSKLGPSVSNEARFALVGGTVVFFPDVGPPQFTNQGGLNLVITDSFVAPNANTLTTATATANIQRRNGPIQTFSDSVTWGKGNHAFTFGGDFTRTNLFVKFIPGGSFLRSINFGIDTTTLGGDPANAIFSSANFPSASSTQLGEARAIYATLVGRMTSVGGNAVADEKLNYTLLGDLTERAGQKAWGLFAQDSYRFRPNITINLGLRYELQGPYYAKNNAYTVPLGYANIFGCSGPNNFFHPDTCNFPITQFQRLPPGSKAYNTDWNNLAPTFGIAYSPDFKKGFMHALLGNSGQSVLRLGYSIAYVSDGTNVGSTGLDTNPGQAFSVTRSTGNDTAGNLSACSTCLPVGSLLRNGLPGVVIAPPPFPFTPGTADQGIAFAPNMRTGYTQSWSAGIQREVMKDTVVEARYVGNRAHKLTRLFSLNEVNTIENGFRKEFGLAQANLIANNNFRDPMTGAATRAGSFAYFGAGTGTSPLPIFLAYLNGQPAANAGTAALYTSTNFANTAITNNMTPVAPSPTGVAGSLSGSAGLRANAVNAGLPRNFFVVNPDMPGGVFLVNNGAMSTYDALQIEVRRRLSKGLLVQGNYTFSKSLTDLQASSSIAQNNYTTLRFPQLNKALSPFDITQSVKGDFIYELPFGKGKWLGGGVGTKTNWLVGGWSVNGTFRIQSGSPFNLGNVQLINMTRQQLQSFVKIRKTTVVFFLPQNVIDNTIKAFTVNPLNAISTTTGYGSAGGPDLTQPFIAPAGFANCQFGYNGQCGFSNVILKGPRFTRFDLSIAKHVTFSESKNLEFRVEALNAFNNINFKVGSFANDVTNLAGTFATANFGQTTVAYQDTSTTTDPGGRLIQFVLRLNF